MVIDLDRNKIIEVNEAFTRMTGMRKEEILHQPPKNLANNPETDDATRYGPTPISFLMPR